MRVEERRIKDGMVCVSVSRCVWEWIRSVSVVMEEREKLKSESRREEG
jgi:hypothetical protein